MPRDEFVAVVPALLAEMQAGLFAEAKAMLDANIRTDIRSFDALAEYFGAAPDDEDEAVAFRGWVRAPWSRPTGAALDAVEARLKTLKLTLRNIPQDQSGAGGQCLFTGEPAVEDVLIARAY
jgi:prolyl-tRNA synthetase